MLNVTRFQPAITALLLMTAGCGGAASTESETVGETAADAMPIRATFDDDEARSTAVGDLSSETFQTSGDTSLCTEDCSGHDAGFAWAGQHEITDASECSGQSQSFIEGCEAFAEAAEAKIDEARKDAGADDE